MKEKLNSFDLVELVNLFFLHNKYLEEKNFNMTENYL